MRIECVKIFPIIGVFLIFLNGCNEQYEIKIYDEECLLHTAETFCNDETATYQVWNINSTTQGANIICHNRGQELTIPTDDCSQHYLVSP